MWILFSWSAQNMIFNLLCDTNSNLSRDEVILQDFFSAFRYIFLHSYMTDIIIFIFRIWNKNSFIIHIYTKIYFSMKKKLHKSVSPTFIYWYRSLGGEGLLGLFSVLYSTLTVLILKFYVFVFLTCRLHIYSFCTSTKWGRVISIKV